MTRAIGERVRNRTDMAHLYADSPWGPKLAIPRLGTVRDVPLATATVGEGTLLIEWDSLNGGKKDPLAWQVWLHSSLLEKAA
jgi:hypothetical protein